MAEIESLQPAGEDWLVSTSDGDFRARAVIVATGSRLRRLGVPGEERLWGKGVSQCASCDGPLFRNRVAGVVGGGDSALQEALELAGHVGQVIVFHRGEELSAQQTYRRRVLEHPKIGVRFGTVVEEILGEDSVAGVRTREPATGAAAEVELAALFVFVGTEPNTGFLRELLRLDGDGRVPTDTWLRTELPGVLAAGDVRRDSAGQAIAAAGDGATAAVAAHRYLAGGSWPPAPSRA